MLRAAAVLLLLAVTSCERASTQAQPQQPASVVADGARAQPQPAAPQDARPPRAQPAVVLIDGKGAEHRVAVEVADTAEERRVGLMYRRHLPPEAGMLFLFDRDEVHSFWMRNTLIPLDMIFIRADMTVAGVVENAPPLTEDGRSIGKPSRHVLEVNAGWARRHGVEAGTRVRFENLEERGP